MLLCMAIGIAILTLSIGLYTALADRLGHWSITMPIVFFVVGLVLSPKSTNFLPIAPSSEVVKTLTEVTLALLLFANASALELSQALKDISLPAPAHNGVAANACTHDAGGTGEGRYGFGARYLYADGLVWSAPAGISCIHAARHPAI